jgi:sugar lactone lactonase YvrE
MMKMPGPTLLFTLLFITLTLHGCGTLPAPVFQEPAPVVVWPSPPEIPRIQYLHSLSRPEDIGITTSFFGRVANFLIGGKQTAPMVRPYGVYFRRGVLYTADPGLGVVHLFDQDNRRYSQIHRFGRQELISPIGVTMDNEGFLYVSDSALKKIFVFGPKGEPVREIGDGHSLQRPTGLAIDPKRERLYVADAADHSVRAFDLTGRFIFHIGKRGIKEGEFNFPSSLTVDGQGNIYVNDSLNYRIQVFGPDGVFLYLLGKHGDGMGEFSSPKGVALDTEGHLYVADAILDTVQIFDKEGRLLLYFGRAGQAPGEFWMPVSIFIDEMNRIYIADSFNRRVQVFKFLGGK